MIVEPVVAMMMRDDQGKMTTMATDDNAVERFNTAKNEYPRMIWGVACVVGVAR